MLFVTVVTCLLNFVLVLQYHRRYLWSPLPWFFLVAGLYYGLGPLIYYFGNSATIDYLDAYYVVSRETLLKLAAINSTCVLLPSARFVTWSLALWPRMSYFTAWAHDHGRVEEIDLRVFAIGVPVQYPDASLHEFQIIEVAVPGSILACGYFALGIWRCSCWSTLMACRGVRGGLSRRLESRSSWPSCLTRTL